MSYFTVLNDKLWHGYKLGQMYLIWKALYNDYIKPSMLFLDLNLYRLLPTIPCYTRCGQLANLLIIHSLLCWTLVELGDCFCLLQWLINLIGGQLCDMAYIVPMHVKPKFTYLLTWRLLTAVNMAIIWSFCNKVFSSKTLTIDTPWLALTGEFWGLYYEVYCSSCICYWYALCTS